MKMNLMNIIRQYAVGGKRLGKEIFEEDFIQGIKGIAASHPDYIKRDAGGGVPTFTVYSSVNEHPDSICCGHVFYGVSRDRVSISGYDITDKGLPGFSRRAYAAVCGLYEKSGVGSRGRA